MSTISIHRTELLRITHNRFRQRHRRTIPPWRMTINSRSSDTSKKEDLSVQISKSSAIPQVDQLRPDGLRFDRLQPPEPESVHQDRLEFGRFVAREAMLDEEYWTAAWLRAESHWEDRGNERYVDNFKRKFAEQEFNAIKRRCIGQKCSCIVAVKKEERHIKRSVIKSVVGTLDLSIRFFLQGETFPGEKVKSQLFCSINREGSSRYGYIANLCVAKSARRQGIACNMLRFAVESARLSGVEQVYVHVHRNNSVAQELYQKTGFEVKNLKFITLKIDVS
ncbi:unnamed protein product [Arabis nemorensis]|uniref:N-acetyltransferase domain-containing protein n=1 Tax=Arabis nemorensis TaxID=586526 RepID=A0A565BCI4_9BRAS|nr:unnamed protein product [Arabis nemorensis]